MFEKDVKEVHWCGAMVLREVEVLGEFSGWVRKQSVLESNNHRDSIEYPGGQGT